MAPDPKMWIYLELVRTLTVLYYNQRSIETVLDRAGFPPGHFNLQGTALEIWTGIIKKLEVLDNGNCKRVIQLLDVVVDEYSDNPVIDGARQCPPHIYKSTISGEKPGNKGGADGSRMYKEKITNGISTLLPIGFLEIGSKRARAVGRVVTPEGLGSGFLISDTDLFITNNHVLGNKELAAASTVQFNYQLNVDGKPDQVETVDVDAEPFQTSEDFDWSVVKLKGNPSSRYGFLKFSGNAAVQGDFVNIVQHPGGEFKQIGLYHNMVTYADDKIVQYLTDTLPGSSGSPVFNSKWEVVALHHSGGWVEAPELKNTPGISNPVLRNEGIVIKAISGQLKALNVI